MTPLYIKRHDTARKISATLLFNSVALDLTNASKVDLIFRPKATTTGSWRRETTITTAVEGKVEYQLVDEDTETAGDYFIEFEVTFLDLTVLSVPNQSWYELVIQPDLA